VPILVTIGQIEQNTFFRQNGRHGGHFGFFVAKIKSLPELVIFNLCTKFENDRMKIVTCNVNTRNCCHLTQC
jgi:hypothetical protein